MAIFTGTWKDVDGDPFTPEGQVLHTTAGGGQVSLNRHGNSNPKYQAKFLQIKAYLYHRWSDVLTNFMKYLWYTAVVGIPTGRMGSQYPYLCGFLKYYSCCFAEVWVTGKTEVTYPYAVQTQASGEWVERAVPGEEYLSFGMSFNQNYYDDETNLCVVYQMKPYKTKTPGCWRDTRIIACHKVVQDDDYVNYFAGKPQWPLEEDRTARFYFRIRYAGGYRREWSQSYQLPVNP